MRRAEAKVLGDFADFIVVGKPAGLAVIPERPLPGQEAQPTLLDVLGPDYPNLMVVHRIDRDTSGLVLLAKGKEAHRRLSLAFQERRVEKTYHALVLGRPDWETSECSLRIRADGDREHRSVVDHRRGKDSLTRFRVLALLGRYCLLEASPETGRTHQIRLHLSKLGFPIVCDPLYGDGKSLLLSEFKPGRHGDPFEERPLLGRLALHALSLRLDQDCQPREFEAPYPKDFQASVNQLKKRFEGD